MQIFLGATKFGGPLKNLGGTLPEFPFVATGLAFITITPKHIVYPCIKFSDEGSYL